jgi:hypothetical protein
METDVSLPHSQQPVTCPYRESDQSKSCPRPPFYRGAGKSLARPGRKQATATEGFNFHISYL